MKSPSPPSKQPPGGQPTAPPGGDERRGSAGPRAIAEMADRLTRRSLGKRGFTEAALVAEWPAIVGGVLGANTLPLRIAFPAGERAGGTLHVRVGSGALATELAHLEPLVLQRINAHFGYRAVARLAIARGPVKKRPARRPPAAPALDAADESRLQARLVQVDDPELKAALAALGRRLAARK